MSEHRPAGTPASCGEDVAAYALDALSPHEAERMRRHLAGCAVCSEELTAFRQVIADLAITPHQHAAPPALRRQVLRAVADEPRLDPAARRSRRAGAARRSIRLPVPRLSPARSGGFAVALAAVIVAVVLALGSGSGHTRTLAAQVTGSGDASLRVSGGHAELVVHRFPAPARGKIYEVWLKHGSGDPQPTSALFGVTRGGSGDVDVPGSLRGVTQVLVTPEPSGGSTVPTHAPVIAVRL